MIEGRVDGVTDGGWWRIHVPYRKTPITLPTFLLPSDSRRGDRVTLARVGGPCGFWRILGVHRPISSKYGRRHLR